MPITLILVLFLPWPFFYNHPSYSRNLPGYIYCSHRAPPLLFMKSEGSHVFFCCCVWSDRRNQVRWNDSSGVRVIVRNVAVNQSRKDLLASSNSTRLGRCCSLWPGRLEAVNSCAAKTTRAWTPESSKKSLSVGTCENAQSNSLSAAADFIFIHLIQQILSFIAPAGDQTCSLSRPRCLSFHSMSETRCQDMESESCSRLLDSMELLSMSYSVLSFDVQLCLLPARRWRWDRNNGADILCDTLPHAQRAKWSLLGRVMRTGSPLSCNGMERIKKGTKWERLRQEMARWLW